MARLALREWLSPFRLIDEIRRDFEALEERLFGHLWSSNGVGGWQLPSLLMAPSRMTMLGATDIYEQNGNLVFETELPGVRREDVHVRVQGHRLLISGEVKRSEEVNEENYFHMGRTYGQFQRSFLLPEEAVTDLKKIQAQFKDGVLRVTVPLKQSLKGPEPIEIQVQ